MFQPKTPSRTRARSDVGKTPKTPLTPSVLAGISQISLNTSPSKQRTGKTHAKSSSSSNPFDTTNPFIQPSTSTSRSRSRSRPASPVKFATGAIPVSEDLKGQAGGGLIRKGGVELSRLDVVSRDYIPPKPEVKRSRSTPAANRDTRDRFITSRETENDVAATLEQLHLNPKSASPGHTARLAAATGVPLNRRILGYHEPPPAASSDTSLAQQREFAKPLYARPGIPLHTSTGASTNKSRKIPTQPERVLDAPGIVDDFYLNLISWSCQNTLAVALEASTYIWHADSGSVAQIGEAPEGSYVSSLDFSNDGTFLGVGLGQGDVELWDAETGQKLRTMNGHQAQVATLSWNQHILTSGCGDGSIWHHDVRIQRHKVMELLGHSGEVCGLKWRSDGELLASGGNDNVVNIWDGRLGDVGEGARGSAKWTKRNHTAAVKGLAWCPWQTNLLASGGGTNDCTINVWNSTTGARLHTQRTNSQITSILWALHKKEILTTHGYPNNSIMLHAYPSMERVAEIRDAHDSRVLFSCVGPAGDVVCTGAGDENLKFWRIWDVVGDGSSKKRKENEERRTNSTSSGHLSIR
ncbi:WD40-repeat-containing domain protein [Lentinula raphanica]|uniref:WD40-repeat-containing domain protein n=1 Tax=Lentinula raphanica TaxID=153919 RepID=A0AA38P5K3_9AGAR|nr:WD40-repeat-containing domain protein [Lentinula raphanica]KAJ3836694.1 WD40-repeat-containing domain protein [Lentinula raphanica]